ncbi:MAG TPA: response regulator, partial [Euryarchaeota archaeon]|nr:response regulator [Euryarchaeota archaeon]
MATTKIVLERAGYTVIEAESGAECLEKLKKNQPDLILLDVMLPDESGWGRVQKDQKRWENKGHFSCYVYCAHKRG